MTEEENLIFFKSLDERLFEYAKATHGVCGEVGVPQTNAEIISYAEGQRVLEVINTSETYVIHPCSVNSGFRAALSIVYVGEPTFPGILPERTRVLTFAAKQFGEGLNWEMFAEVYMQPKNIALLRQNGFTDPISSDQSFYDY